MEPYESRTICSSASLGALTIAVWPGHVSTGEERQKAPFKANCEGCGCSTAFIELSDEATSIYFSFFGSSSLSWSAISQLDSVKSPSLSRFLPLSLMAPLILLLTSSKLTGASIVLKALNPPSLPLKAPPAELLRLRDLGVWGLEAKKPKAPMLLNASLPGKRPKDLPGPGDRGSRSSISVDVGVDGSVASSTRMLSGIFLYLD